MRDRIGFVVLIAIAVVAPVSATTVSVGGTALANEGQISSVAGATTVDFNTLSAGGPQMYTLGIASYSNLFIRRVPAGTPDIEGDTSPFADPNATAGDLTVNFAAPIVYFGLYWGSPDPLNLISFYNGTNLVFSYTGQQLNTNFGVPLGDPNAAYVDFTAAPGETYTRIVISSQGSFPVEDDNQAFIAAAPEAGAWLLSLSGIAFLLLVRRKKFTTRGSHDAPRLTLRP